MVEEAFDIPAKMEKIEPRGFCWRRNSTGNINTKIFNGEANNTVLPRYLSAPIASCHDSCKYGSKRSNNNNDEAAARTRLHKKFASNLQKKPVPEIMQREKKFAATRRLPSYPKKQTSSQEHDVNKRAVLVSLKHHQISSSNTRGMSRSSKKDSTDQSRVATRTKQRKPSQRPKKQDIADKYEEHVPEKTLFVIKEHTQDSTNHNSSCCLEAKTELNSEQENVSSPRKLVLRRGKIVEGKLCKDGSISPRKLVLQYIFVEENKDSTENANKPAEEDVFGDVKTLIGIFESSFQDGSSSPAITENGFCNVKALISAFESVISRKLLSPNRLTDDTIPSLIDSTD